MKAERTINWETKSGTKLEVKIERTRTIMDKVAYCDG